MFTVRNHPLHVWRLNIHAPHTWSPASLQPKSQEQHSQSLWWSKETSRNTPSQTSKALWLKTTGTGSWTECHECKWKNRIKERHTHDKWMGRARQPHEPGQGLRTICPHCSEQPGLIAKGEKKIMPLTIRDRPSCTVTLFIFLILIIVYYYYFLAALSLRCSMQAFSSCGVWALEHAGSAVLMHELSGCGMQTSLAAMHGLSCCETCGLWHLSSLTRDQTCIPCIGRWILNHWTTREVPAVTLFLKTKLPGEETRITKYC